MNIWELPKEHYKWESPITKIYGDIRNEIISKDEENCIFAIEQAIGYKVDKEELIKALQYDREQYDKGYKDGVRETFVEELEKIKTEIQDLIDFEESCCGNTTLGYQCLGVVENRISELKGEKNEL